MVPGYLWWGVVSRAGVKVEGRALFKSKGHSPSKLQSFPAPDPRAARDTPGPEKAARIYRMRQHCANRDVSWLLLAARRWWPASATLACIGCVTPKQRLPVAQCCSGLVASACYLPDSVSSSRRGTVPRCGLRSGAPCRCYRDPGFRGFPGVPPISLVAPAVPDSR